MAIVYYVDDTESLEANVTRMGDVLARTPHEIVLSLDSAKFIGSFAQSIYEGLRCGLEWKCGAASCRECIFHRLNWDRCARSVLGGIDRAFLSSLGDNLVPMFSRFIDDQDIGVVPHDVGNILFLRAMGLSIARLLENDAMTKCEAYGTREVCLILDLLLQECPTVEDDNNGECTLGHYILEDLFRPMDGDATVLWQVIIRSVRWDEKVHPEIVHGLTGRFGGRIPRGLCGIERNRNFEALAALIE